MNEQIFQIASRIREMRELLDISAEQMAEMLSMPAEEYKKYEGGAYDFPFSFLYEIARRLNVDVTEILTGEIPRLTSFNLVRRGQGVPVERNQGFNYNHLAYLFKDRKAVPLYVTAKFDTALAESPMELNRHEGHEFDYILSGQLRVHVSGHEFVMEPGDSLYYDSMSDHGMVAVGGEDCVFLAVLIEN